MYQCFHCLAYGVVWDSDFTFEDYGLDGEGIVHVCHCENCGARVEYYVPTDDPSKNKYVEDEGYNITEEQYKAVEECVDALLEKHK